MEEKKQSCQFELSRDVLAKANIGLWAIEIVEGENPRMFADATMCRLLGIEEGLAPEAVYHAWYDNVDPHHYDAVARAVDKMVAGSHAEVQYPWHHPEKGETFVRCGGIRNMGYTRGIRIEGCHQDVTELIHVQKQATLTELENKFLEKMLLGIPAPLFIKTADDSRYRLCNQAFADLHRRTPEAIRALSDYDLFPRSFAETFVAHDRETMESPGIHYFPCHACGVGDAARQYDKWEACIDGGDGHRYIVGSLWDVTEFKRAERAKSEFFAKVSHDIRTPLNAVIGYSQMLSAGVDSPQERKEYLESITFSAETLLDLINDVLDLSKIESGKIVISPEPCDFAELVRNVLRSVAPRATSRATELEAHVDGLPVIDIDMHHVRQVLFNLVGNAVKFTDHGFVSVDAAFERTDAAVGRLVFTVRDTGIGMSPEDVERVFLPFIQASNNAARQGTGLGLPICRQLVEAMGGQISVRSELGGGSAFTVEIGNLAYRSSMPSVKRVGAGIGKGTNPVSELRLLLVDDIKMNLSVLSSMLRRMGVEKIDTASDGIEALEKLEKSPFGYDAVLTDMWMPRCDGLELVKRIRATDATATLPVYAVTADAECKGGCADDFSGVLLKPLTLEGVRDFVRGICS